MKRFCLILSILLICSGITFALSFSDLSQSHWAYKYIMVLSSKNVINGYTDGTFRPDGTITNAEFIKLVVMAAMPDWLSIDDAESSLNHWAGKYIWVAERNGIITSSSINLNNIDKPITRIEMVRIISKADLIMKGNNLETSKKVTFSDVLSLNDDDMTLLKHACTCDLISGYTDNTFKPFNNMKRSEAATMIYRFESR